MSISTTTIVTLVLLGTGGISILVLLILHRSIHLSQLFTQGLTHSPSLTGKPTTPQSPTSNATTSRPYLSSVAVRPPRFVATSLPPSTVYSLLSSQIIHHHNRHRATTYLSRSTYLGQDTTLFSRRPGHVTVYPGEICHLHPRDDGVAAYVTLHPLDAHAVVEAGWGFFPTTRLWWRSSSSAKVALYPPRDPDEVALVMELVRAAAWWVGGVDGRCAAWSWT